MVEVPDARLQRLTELVKPKKQFPQRLNLQTSPELLKVRQRRRAGKSVLSHIRQVDAICHVVRCFDDENIMREQNRDADFVDPLQTLIQLI